MDVQEETNSLGEKYYWLFTPKKATTWDEATKAWDAPGNNQPWDTYGIEGGWTVKTNRTLYIIENRGSYLHRWTQEYVAFLDAQFTNQQGVFSDIDVSDGGSTLADFRERATLGTPTEYYDARPLVPGEYTYQKAIIGIRMRSYSRATKLGFYKATLSVDVEDILCRGNVDVVSTDPENPTRVDFNRFYYNPPEEIMFNILEYTEPCKVEVLTKTPKYFTFMLRSTITNKYVTGRVSWLSTGY